jgi:hypothetical protein
LQNGRIYRKACSNGSSNCSTLPITAPDIEITRFDVYDAGAEQSYSPDREIIQPVAVFVIEGTAASQNIASAVYGKKKKTRVQFKLQTVATQRILDL